MSVTELYERSKAYDAKKYDQTEYVSSVSFTPQGIALPDSLFNGPATYPMADWALGQACQKLGDPPTSYAKRCPGWLRANNLNHWRKQLSKRCPDKQWLLRTFGDNCRAVLSDTYSPFSNSDMLAYIMEYVDQDFGKAVQGLG